MRRFVRSTLALVLFPLAGTGAKHAVDVELRGSPESMVRQHEIARNNDYDFLDTPGAVREYAMKGRLVSLKGGESYRLHRIRYPYAQPEVRIFIERLSAQYREHTGEPLVVTSLTRPASRQPGNSHALSVHPAGMAVDLRVPRTPASRSWLEGALLSLEEKGVLDATRERRPPHYHVAIFPAEYREHVGALLDKESARPGPDDAAPDATAEAGIAGSELRGVNVTAAAALVSLFGLVALRRLRRPSE